MKGPDASLRHLQRALTMELTTVNTYLWQERQLDDWGIDRLAARMREETDEERHHAALFLTRLADGQVNLAELAPPAAAETAPEKEKAEPPVFLLADFTLSDGRLVFRDSCKRCVHEELRRVVFHAPFIS